MKTTKKWSKVLSAGMAAMVLAFGFMAVSCGGDGGNINIVKNGVFENVDASITVGKALENNSTLKGGKWAELEKDGRNYVTYTVKFTPTQIEDFLGEREKPNLKNAETLGSKLQIWKGNISYLPELTTMTAEEVSNAYDIFSATLSKHNKKPELKDFFYPFTMDAWGRTVLKEEYFGQWFRANKENILRQKVGEDIEDIEDIEGYIEDHIIRPYSIVIGDLDPRSILNWDSNILKDVQNGKLTGNFLSMYENQFSELLYTSVEEEWSKGVYRRVRIESEMDIAFQKDIADTITRLYSEKQQAEAQLKIAQDEFSKMRDKDTEPLFTINGYEITVSFLMNMDGTFVPNAVESYTEITMNCLDNLKVRFGAGITTGNSAVLSMVYRSFTPKVI